MNEEINDIALRAKNALERLAEDQKLKEKEQRMENDEQVMVLSYHFDCAQNEYNEALKIFKQDSDEVKEAQRKLYLAKKELEEHPLVREYLEAYSVVRKKYSDLQALASEILQNSNKDN